MHSGSDSDSFDEGDLTARGRKAKGKAALRANEKGKQKAKDVRTQCPLVAPRSLQLMLRWHTTIAGLCLGGYVHSLLGHGTGRRGGEPHRRGCGPACARTTTEVRVLPPPSFLAHTHMPLLLMLTSTYSFSDSSRRPRRYAVRSSAISSSCWTSRRR
jgi:hypothetical protein